MQQVGIVGLGLVGSALAARLLAAGHAVGGFDIDSQQCDRFVQLGGKPASSPAELCQQSEIVLLSLPDSGVAASVVDQMLAGLRPGQLVIDTTTGGPEEAARLGERLARHGARFLDATIAGSSAQVASGEVTVMVGGPADAYGEALPLFSHFARQTFHVGPWGSGARIKLVVNLVLGLNRAVLAEGLSLAAALGLDQHLALEVLKASSAYSTAMDTKGDKMLSRDFAVQARLSQHLKDVRLILAAAERTGQQLPLSMLHRQLLERLEAAGYGALDNSVIIRAFEAELPPPS